MQPARGPKFLLFLSAQITSVAYVLFLVFVGWEIVLLIFFGVGSSFPLPLGGEK